MCVGRELTVTRDRKPVSVTYRPTVRLMGL